MDAGFVLRPMHVGLIDNALQRVDRTSVVARMTPTKIFARRAGNGSTRMGRLISFPDALSTPGGGVRWLRPSAHRVPIWSVEDIVNWSYGQVTGPGAPLSQEVGSVSLQLLATNPKRDSGQDRESDRNSVVPRRVCGQEDGLEPVRACRALRTVPPLLRSDRLLMRKRPNRLRNECLGGDLKRRTAIRWTTKLRRRSCDGSSERGNIFRAFACGR